MLLNNVMRCCLLSRRMFSLRPHQYNRICLFLIKSYGHSMRSIFRNTIGSYSRRYFFSSSIHYFESPVKYVNSDAKFGEYSQENIDFVVDYLLDDEVSQDDVKNIFKKHSKLGHYSRSTWEKLLTYFKDYGISSFDIVKMLIAYPQILQRNVSELEEIFSCLRAEGFADKKLIHLIVNLPSLLISEPKFIKEQIAFLMTIFTRSDMFVLAKKCPNVFLDDADYTEEKVQYIVNEVGVDQKEILSSRVLSYDLSYIKLRHQLLLRTGFYKKPHPKKTNSNPRLSFIMDAPTSDLIKHIGICLEEYKLFEKLFNVELEKSEVVLDNDDDDDCN